MVEIIRDNPLGFARNYNFMWKLSKLNVDQVGLIPSKLDNILKARTALNTAKNTEEYMKIGSAFNSDGSLDAALLELANQAFLDYISSRARKFSPPADVLKTEDIDIGVIKYSIPVGFEIPDITVEFVEDGAGTVYNFHKYWQRLAQVKNKMLFNPLKKVCFSGYYAMKTNMGQLTGGSIESMESLDMDVIIPTTLIVYPQIFPYKITRSEMDMGGNGISSVNVTYKRLPNIKRPIPFQII